MKAIETITGPVSTLMRDDIDTDQIIPKQFLKRVERTGFGEFLFYDWAKEPGCSMCLAMNPDKLGPGQRCASTSSRNFEGRQGRGGRTHLMSPAMAAAAAIAGHIVDVRAFLRP